MDAHYISTLHGDIGGIKESEMASVATSYYDLAMSEPDVAVLLGYFWPGGFDDPSARARELPQMLKMNLQELEK
ncbi:MAG: hypothetical protein IPL23_24530 [Saprospiraceae bacterium]|nr:hypothetical protein [Saprospiraceae bacterium]